MGRLRLLHSDLRRAWALLERHPEPVAAAFGAVGIVMYWKDIFPDIGLVLLIAGVGGYALLTSTD